MYSIVLLMYICIVFLPVDEGSGWLVHVDQSDQLDGVDGVAS